MHLHESDPLLVARFFGLLHEAVERALSGNEPPALFLLGDLFEYWIGDDHVPDIAHEMAALLATFAGKGVRIFLMHGNRDFLIDVPIPPQPGVTPFSRRCGGVLLADPAVIEVAGRRIVLSHGDALCTDDTRYQQWRALCRSTAWQQQFLSRPVSERLAMALGLRQQSLQAQAATETIHDVNPGAVDALMTRLDADLLIHGHTHQPQVKRWDPAQPPEEGTGSPARPVGGSRTRWVLSDWAHSPPRGSVLSLAAAIPPAC